MQVGYLQFEGIVMFYEYDKEAGTITAKVSTLVIGFILFWFLTT